MTNIASRALVCVEPATPPRLEMRARPLPRPEAGQVLVRVAATSVNPIDAKRAAGYGRRLLRLKGAASFPLVLGSWREWQAGRSAIAERASSARYGWTLFKPDREALDVLVTGLREKIFSLPIGICASFDDATKAFAHVATAKSGGAVLLPHAATPSLSPARLTNDRQTDQCEEALKSLTVEPGPADCFRHLSSTEGRIDDRQPRDIDAYCLATASMREPGPT